MNEILDKIKNKEMFSFSRWGDGEWNCLMADHVGGRNCDGHNYFPDMGERMLNILKSSPKYMVGMQNMAYRQRKEVIDKMTTDYSINWVNADIFHATSIKNNNIDIILEALKGRTVVLVGGNHLMKYSYEHGWGFIEVPRVNCWNNYRETLQTLNELLSNTEEHIVVLFCASMMTNVLIDDLDGRATLIDMGSVFDPYAGIKSRSYHLKVMEGLKNV